MTTISYEAVPAVEGDAAAAAGNTLVMKFGGTSVGDTQKMAADLEPLGLTLWDGELEESGRLAFLGERARTLILSPERRGWLPTGRPAGPNPVDVLLTGPPAGEVRTAGHRVSRRVAPLRSLP